jgi:hypothetical protein
MLGRRSAVTAVLSALTLSACGGSTGPSLSAFKTGFENNKASFRTLGLDLQHAITGAKGKTDAELASEFGGLATRAKQQAASLAKLKPTAKYKTDLSNLVSAFDAVGTDLDNISQAATRHSSTGAQAATVTLITDAAKVKAADGAITAGLHLPAT